MASCVGSQCRYAFDVRFVPVWLTHMAVDAFVIFHNYFEVVGYVGESFKKCFEESYCFAVIELANRNLGPFTALMCMMFYGRRHKVAALAGTERVLRFLRETDDDCTNGCIANNAVSLSPIAKYYSTIIVVAYCAVVWLYWVAVPAKIVAPYCVNAVGQTALHNLAMFQYYVMERGYARINWLLDNAHVSRNPSSVHRSLARLADTHDRLGRLVDHLNRAYVLSMLVKWPYSIMRVIMVVFRIIEMSADIRFDDSFARIPAILIVEHVCEMLLFILQLVCFCTVGTRLAYQASDYFVQFVFFDQTSDSFRLQ